MKTAKKTFVLAVILGSFVLSSVALAGSDPKIYTFSDYTVMAGDKIKIKGENFGKRRGKVTIDYIGKVKIKKWRKNRIYFIVPDIEAQKSYKIRVCKRNGDCSRSQKFYLTRKGPEMYKIKNLTHKKDKYVGVPGDKLKITGRNFHLSNIQVYFGNQAVRITSRTRKWISFYIPSDIQRGCSYSVYVTNGENPSETQDFYVKP